MSVRELIEEYALNQTLIAVEEAAPNEIVLVFEDGSHVRLSAVDENDQPTVIGAHAWLLDEE